MVSDEKIRKMKEEKKNYTQERKKNKVSDYIKIQYKCVMFHLSKELYHSCSYIITAYDDNLVSINMK